MKSHLLRTATVLLACIAGAANAGTDPLTGTWKADLKPGQGDIRSLTMTIAPAPGGYTFENDIHPRQGGEMKTSLAVVPDGKPHTANTSYGPITATCHRTDPRTLDCATAFMGTDATSTFALSADGKTLTETDVNEVQHVHYSSRTDISVDNSKVTQGPTTSHNETTESHETTTTVFHKQ